MQVLPTSNLGNLRRLLPQDKKTVIKEYEGLNHLLQHCTLGTVAEYNQIEEIISEEVLTDVAEWVNGVRKNTICHYSGIALINSSEERSDEESEYIHFMFPRFFLPDGRLNDTLCYWYIITITFLLSLLFDVINVLHSQYNCSKIVRQPIKNR